MSNTSLTSKVSGSMSSRGWAIALGIGAIVLAAILLVFYLDRYRSRVSSENAPTPVLVAKQVIPKGTPGSLIGANSMYVPTTVPRKEVKIGAISDPALLVGRAAAVDILPGQQITATDIAAADTSLVKSQLVGDQRGISVSLDAVRGSLAQVQAGDSVDIYISAAGAIKLFRDNVKVLAMPGPEGGAITLRVPSRDAADFAYAMDNTTLWFVVRPVVGAKPTPNDTATAATVIGR